MKVLVAVQSYPSTQKDPDALYFVHPRSLFYQKKGIDLDILSFKAKESYTHEGVTVLPTHKAQKALRSGEYDLFINHSPNVFSHIYFILKNLKYLKKVIFILHGHEILNVRQYYRMPYKYQKKLRLKWIMRGLYDPIKIFVLGAFFKFLVKRKNTEFIFVSDHLRRLFFLTFPSLENAVFSKTHIISNPASRPFINSHYQPKNEYTADFITIRPLNRSEFLLDKLCELANNHPGHVFYILGKGDYFDHNEKPSNVIWDNNFLDQKDIPELLNNFKCALMLSAHDSQGVTSCEVATYGMPLITSNTPAAAEMFSGFSNVKLISNDEICSLRLDQILSEVKPLEKKPLRFTPESTILKEVELIKKA